MAMNDPPILPPSAWLDTWLDTVARSFKDAVLGHWWIILIVTIVIILTTSPRR